MALLSLKRFLDVGEAEQALRKVVLLFLESIRAAAVEGNRADHESFREEMQHLSKDVEGDLPPQSLFVIAGSATRAMTDYNRRITAFLRKQSDELHGIVTMVAETALRMGGENQLAAQRLREIGKKFEQAGEMHDLHSLKAHLQDCLQNFREETERQKAESEAAILALQREVERRPACNPQRTAADADPVTGLPRQAAGIREMQEAARNGKHLYVVAMVVKGVQAVNARFGFEVGDRMLQIFAQNMERQMPRADKLFRWEGPALVLLLDRPESIEQIRGQMRRMLDVPMESTFDGDGRAVMIPISAAWTLLNLTLPVALTLKQIQMFIAGQGSPAPSHG